MAQLDGSSAERLLTLERTVASLQSRLELIQPQPDTASQHRQTRLAKTTTSGSYPVSGDTVEIVFLNGSFTETTGNQTPTYNDRQTSGFAIAHNINPDELPPENTIIWVIRHDGQWWFWWGSTDSDLQIDLVEVTEIDGNFTVATPTDELQQATDCIQRARIISQTPDAADLCDRTDVVDGADIWLKILHNPFEEDFTYAEVGQRFLAKRVQEAYTIGANTFPFYETVMDDSRVWGLEAQNDWSGAKNVFIRTYASGAATAKHEQVINDDAGLWDNVIIGGDADSGRGYGIQLGDEYVPIAMRRRATHFDGNLTSHLSAEDGNIGVDTLQIVSESPFIDLPAVAVVTNTRRLHALSSTPITVMRNANAGANWEITSVARSDPLLIELQGSPDGTGLAPEVDAGTFLAVWSARLTNPNPSDGTLAGGGGISINEDDIWFGYTGPSNAADPHYATAGSRALAYDTGKEWLPTGGTDPADRKRLYLAPRDDQTYYGEAYENWTRPGGGAVDFVRVRPIDDLTGSNREDTVTHTVLLPQHAGLDPNVVTGDRITYRLGMDGLWVAVGDYLDAKIKTMDMWLGTVGEIRPGWAIMDGAANAPGNGGTGINMTSGASVDGGGFFARGSTSAGVSGGTATHKHDLDIEISASAFADALNLTIEIDPHEVSDLAHSHNLRGGTVVVVQSGTGTNLDIPSLSCTIDEPKAGFVDGSSTDAGNPAKINNCPTEVWGPLEHSFSSTIESPGETVSFTEAFANSETDPSQHLPEYKTVIFIERLDNSL